MPSTFSDRLKLELQASGENSGTWGDKTNNNLSVLDAFAGGYLSKSVAGSSDVTLTTANASPTAESSNKVIELTVHLLVTLQFLYLLKKTIMYFLIIHQAHTHSQSLLQGTLQTV